jgi:transcriptional regulator with XRE-family HTH domain
MDQDQAQELGEHLRRAREEQGFSSRALARMTFMNDASILRMEQGLVAAPAPDKLARIAEALKLDLADVFALAGYAAPTQLPNWRPYLRAKYAELPTEAVDELESFFGYLKSKYGAAATGPVNGEDELPVPTAPARRTKQRPSSTPTKQPRTKQSITNTATSSKRSTSTGRSPTTK